MKWITKIWNTATALQASSLKLPLVPRLEHVSKQIHDVEWVDYFSAMRERRNPEVRRYLKEEQCYTKAFFNRDSGKRFRKELRREIMSRHQYETVSTSSELNGFQYYRRIDPAQNEMVDCRCQILPNGKLGKEQIILDRGDIANDFEGDIDVSQLKISANGRMMVYTVDSTGTERYDAYVVDLDKPHNDGGYTTVDTIENVCSVEWSHDGNTLLYTRANRLMRPSKLLLHTIGTSSSRDRTIFEELDERFFLDVSQTKDGKYFTINSNSKLCSEVWLLPTKLDRVTNHRPTLIHPRAIEESMQFTYFVEHSGDRFYIITNADGAQNYKIVSCPEWNPTKDNWIDFVPTDMAHKIEDAEMFATHCVVHRRGVTGLVEFLSVPYHNPEAAVKVLLPDEYAVSAVIPHPNSNFWAKVFTFSTTNPLVPHTDWAYSLDNSYGELSKMNEEHVVGSPKFTMKNYTVERVLVDSLTQRIVDETRTTDSRSDEDNVDVADAGDIDSVSGGDSSSDGGHEGVGGSADSGVASGGVGVGGGSVQIPVTIVHRKNIIFDGSTPTLLIAYGAYGTVVEPDFQPEHICLLQRGWAIAYCHVRGGGELGYSWHINGRRLAKTNSISDLESCVESLFAMGLTRPGNIVGRGLSAGGFLLAALCNRRPEMFGALIIKVPFLDVVTSLLDVDLPLTLHEHAEWGDPIKSELHMKNLMTLCPIQNIQPQHYPPTLVTASMLDERVQYWHPAKFVARMRETKLDDNLLLFHIEEEGGHFSGGVEQVLLEFDFMMHALKTPTRASPI
eukprot:m.163368 g.163368  ORF g.163368 m.163368 type:complete len:788 (-) comp31287_c0_seq1:64-2427(-)